MCLLRFLQRITPVSNTTHADPNSLKRLAYRILQPLIAPSDYTREQREADEPIKVCVMSYELLWPFNSKLTPFCRTQYRIEPTLRNHTASLNRQVVTDVIGEVVRDLANAHFQFPKRQVVEHAAEPTEKSEGTTPAQAAEPASADATQASSTTAEETKETSNMPTPGQASEESEVKPQGDEAPVEETPWNILPPYRRRIHVDLKHPTHTILVSALRGVCGISVVEGYDEKKKFNVQMLGGNTDMNGRDKPRIKAMEQTTEDAADPNTENADAPASSAEIGPETAESEAGTSKAEAGTSKAESSDQIGNSNENSSIIETVQAVTSDGQANVGETLSAP